jgi:hypothetical protein
LGGKQFNSHTLPARVLPLGQHLTCLSPHTDLRSLTGPHSISHPGNHISQSKVQEPMEVVPSHKVALCQCLWHTSLQSCAGSPSTRLRSVQDLLKDTCSISRAPGPGPRLVATSASSCCRLGMVTARVFALWHFANTGLLKRANMGTVIFKTSRLCLFSHVTRHDCVMSMSLVLQLFTVQQLWHQY